MSKRTASAAPQVKHPQKKNYRQRAHCNPLSHNDCFDYPLCPPQQDWASHFDARLLTTPSSASASASSSGTSSASASPAAASAGEGKEDGSLAVAGRQVEFADVGCGFGGLLVSLSPIYPKSLMVGFEIRSKVSEYVRLRLLALRKEHEPQHTDAALFGNASVVRTNTMRYISNYFAKGQLKKLFFCFPDPHFKTKNHRRRIVSPNLLHEYAYILAEGALLYTVTDVKELHDWMELHCRQHPAFEKLSDADLSLDPAVHCMLNYTEEGLKVARQQRAKYVAVFRRRKTVDIPSHTVKSFWADTDVKPEAHVNNEDWRADKNQSMDEFEALPGMCMLQLGGLRDTAAANARGGKAKTAKTDAAATDATDATDAAATTDGKSAE